MYTADTLNDEIRILYTGGPFVPAFIVGGAAQLAGQGVQQRTLNVGDRVVITGQPSRAPGEYRVLLKTLKRPSDGFSWGTKQGETFD